MPALAYAMTAFVLLPRIQKGLGINAPATVTAATKEKKGAPGAKKEAVTMNKLLVNVAGTMGARYLLVSLSVVGTDPNFKNKMAETTRNCATWLAARWPPKRWPISKSPAPAISSAPN